MTYWKRGGEFKDCEGREEDRKKRKREKTDVNEPKKDKIEHHGEKTLKSI